MQELLILMLPLIRFSWVVSSSWFYHFYIRHHNIPVSHENPSLIYVVAWSVKVFDVQTLRGNAALVSVMTALIEITSKEIKSQNKRSLKQARSFVWFVKRTRIRSNWKKGLTWHIVFVWKLHINVSCVSCLARANFFWVSRLGWYCS